MGEFPKKGSSSHFVVVWTLRVRGGGELQNRGFGCVFAVIPILQRCRFSTLVRSTLDHSSIPFSFISPGQQMLLGEFGPAFKTISVVCFH